MSCFLKPANIWLSITSSLTSFHSFRRASLLLKEYFALSNLTPFYATLIDRFWKYGKHMVTDVALYIKYIVADVTTVAEGGMALFPRSKCSTALFVPGSESSIEQKFSICPFWFRKSEPGPPRASAGPGANHFPGPSTSLSFPLPFPPLPSTSPPSPPPPPLPLKSVGPGVSPQGIFFET